MDRRTLIHLLGATAVGGLAGCASQDDGGAEPPASPTETPSPTPTETATETPMDSETESEVTTQDDASNGDGLVTNTVEETFDETVARIQSDIEDSPLTLMTTVDHAENAASVDRDLPPTTLLLFGNPDVGTPMMQESRTVAIDLPQKMLVWQADDEVNVTYNDPQFLADRHGIEGDDDRIEQIRSAMDGLATGESVSG